jgi:hypothetical protein
MELIMRAFTLSALLLISIMLIVLPCSLLSASQTNISSGVVTVNLSQDNQSVSRLNIKSNQPTHISVENSGQTFDSYSLENESTIARAGFPDLPSISRLVLIPPQSDITLVINSINSHIERDISPVIADYQNSDEQVNVNLSSEYLQCEGFWPPQPVVVGKPAIMRGYRIVSVTTFPMQYNRTTGEMRFNDEFDFELRYEGIGSNIIRNPDHNIRSAMFDKIIGSLVLNPPRRDDPPQQGSILYLCGDRNDVAEELEPLIEWRRRMGCTVELIRVEDNDDEEAIKGIIQEAYDEWDVPPEYVVLCGCGSQNNYHIAYFDETRGGHYLVESDHRYSMLEGDDVLPEAAIGRLVFFSPQELRGIVNKIIAYESIPFIGEDNDLGWQKRAAVVSTDLSSGLSTSDASRWVRNTLIDHGYEDVAECLISHNEAQINPTEFITNNTNDGLSILTARGSMRLNGLYEASIDQLNNDEMLPFVIFATCNTGDFVDHFWGYSYIERFLLNPNGGAIGAVGTSGATYVPYNNLLLAGAIHGLFVSDVTTQGWATMCGKIALYQNYAGLDEIPHPDNPNELSWIMSTYLYNLMGDPATDLFTDQPRQLVVEHSQTIHAGQTRYEVHVAYEDDNTDAAGVQVCLYSPDVFQLVGQTNEEGAVVFRLDPEHLADDNVMLTVTGHNLMSYLADIDVIEDEDYIGAGSWIIDDDDDDNGANPAEEFTLLVEIVNYGEEQPEGEMITVLSTSNPLLEIVDGEAQFDEAPESGSALEAAFIVRILGGFPNGYDAGFDLTVSVGDSEWQSAVSLPVTGPEFIMEELFWVDEFLVPDQETEFDISIENIGETDSEPLTGTLISMTRTVAVIIPTVEYGAINAGDNSEGADPFLVYTSPLHISGSPVEFILVLEGEDGFVDTVFFAITAGTAEESDPFGPDNYGYVCFDNQDENWFIAPEFDWIEIDPEVRDPDLDGVDTELSDTQEEDDESVLIDLPFTFTYYGEEFDRLTICTNGWIAMGNQANLFTGRNQRIPGGMVASGMICPFWNDLLTTNNGGIYTCYYEDEHIFIVEWSKVRRLCEGNSPLLTFEVILFDPDFYPTLTGDGDIVFQYKDIEDTRPCYDWDTPFATVGIGSPDQSDGLEYSYWNILTPGASPLEDELAIKFTTLSQFEAGAIRGVVTDLANAEPIEGVLVSTNYGIWDVTDEDGEYLLENVIADSTFDLQVNAWKEFWTLETIENVEVIEDSTTVLNIQLRHPEFAIRGNNLHFILNPDSTFETSVEICNDGNGPVTYTSKFVTIIDRDEPDDVWDPLLSFNVSENTDDYRINGIVWAEDRWIISGGNNGRDEVNYFYVYDRMLNYQERIEQNSNDRFGARDMEYYNGKLYYSLTSVKILYELDLNTNELSAYELPSRLNGIRNITINPANGHFYMSSVSNGIYELELLGNDSLIILNDFDPIDPRTDDRVRVYGLAWFVDDEDGCPLYIMNNKDIEERPDYPDISIFKMNPETEEIYFLTGLLELNPFFKGEGGISITSKWNNMVWAFAAIFNSPDGDEAFVFELAANHSWIRYEPRAGIVPAGQSQMIEMSIDAANLDTCDYITGIQFNHDAAPGVSLLPIRLTVSYDAIRPDALEAELPFEFSLAQNHPNPFNPLTEISYSLREAVDVRLTVYDIAGREVELLVAENQNAGRYTVNFKADKLAAGLYFYKLEAGSFSSVKKMVLVK